MNNQTMRKSFTFTTLCYALAIAGVLTVTNACNRQRTATDVSTTQYSSPAADVAVKSTPLQQNNVQIQVVNIANIRLSGDGNTTKVMFNQLEELFTVSDKATIATLKEAFAAHKAVQVTFDPWSGTVLHAAYGTSGRNLMQSGTKGEAYKITPGMPPEAINNVAASAMLNTTTDSLTNVIPDFATAQMMFDFITYQACAIPGPYGIDQCISFQYCQDGCYARAHKMCWIINNKYHYNTHKIFSFANAGSDMLCVQAQKWGGCCVQWWYHVAPIVNVKTPAGPKAYVFDPAMFNQPVLLATWLHAQENPVCAGSDVPNVSMINIQPTASYWPADGSGYLFDTDPFYISTNSTLVSYSPLKTCP